MSMINGIAKTSMEMASAKVAAEVQVSVIKNAMDVQQEALAILLNSLGVGRNLNVEA